MSPTDKLMRLLLFLGPMGLHPKEAAHRLGMSYSGAANLLWRHGFTARGEKR